ncbi:gfo/Idh/MocA family oxidoreductase, partial|nr:gfo/Idh/MocA family oxidoreductase [Escherichia coli]
MCDLDKNRADAGPAAVRSNYEKTSGFNGGLKGDWDIKVYYDYKELLANKDIDAVHI